MQHLNYCRQMVKQFTQKAGIPSVPNDVKQLMSHCIDLARASQKFILPDGGRLYDDPEFKALDETVPLCLPYPLIAIEFTRSQESLRCHEHRVDFNVQPTKGLLFARQRNDGIALNMVAWVDAMGVWVPYPEVTLPLTGYLDRTQRINGYVPVALLHNLKEDVTEDYMDEVGALLSMLNILNCANVHVERSEPKNSGKKIKAALPFDTYHVLTIDVPGKSADGAATGGHRSPREHLRRGHIRRLADGRRIWVNATVVGAGRGAGVVTKDYALRSASQRPAEC